MIPSLSKSGSSSTINNNIARDGENASDELSIEERCKQAIVEATRPLPEGIDGIISIGGIGQEEVLTALQDLCELPTGKRLLTAVCSRLQEISKLASDGERPRKLSITNTAGDCFYESRYNRLNLWVQPATMSRRTYPLLVKKEDSIGIIAYEPPFVEIIGHELGHALTSLEHRLCVSNLPEYKELTNDECINIENSLMEARYWRLMGKLLLNKESLEESRSKSGEERALLEIREKSTLTAHFEFQNLWNHGKFGEVINILPEDAICEDPVALSVKIKSTGSRPFEIPARGFPISDGIFLHEYLKLKADKNELVNDIKIFSLNSDGVPSEAGEEISRQIITQIVNCNNPEKIVRFGHGNFINMSQESYYSVYRSVMKLPPSEIGIFFDYVEITLKAIDPNSDAEPPILDSIKGVEIFNKEKAIKSHNALLKKWLDQLRETLPQVEEEHPAFPFVKAFKTALEKAVVAPDGTIDNDTLCEVVKKYNEWDATSNEEARDVLMKCRAPLSEPIEMLKLELPGPECKYDKGTGAKSSSDSGPGIFDDSLSLF